MLRLFKYHLELESWSIHQKSCLCLSPIHKSTFSPIHVLAPPPLVLSLSNLLERGLDFIRLFKALVEVMLFSVEGGIGDPQPGRTTKYVPRKSGIDCAHQSSRTIGLKMIMAASGKKLKLCLLR